MDTFADRFQLQSIVLSNKRRRLWLAPTCAGETFDLAVNFANSNPDFQRPLTWQRPFYARFSVKLEF